MTADGNAAGRPSSAEADSLSATVADLLPIPADTSPVTDPDEHELACTLADEPTLSHALALEDHDEKGIVQQQQKQQHGRFDEDVADLGWNEPKEHIAEPLVGGLDNEDLWLLVRRFNKQLYHVKETDKAAPGNLDLNIADQEEFSPDKLRSNVERFYMEVIICLLAAVKHIARLRSWRERRRTSVCCVAYFTAWAFNFLVPLLSVTLVALIVHPPFRGVLFPPAPVALVDAFSGGIQKPKSGVLGSHDSATGAPENHKGEAVEAEASNFYNGLTSIVVTSATGKHPQSEDDDQEEDGEGNGSPKATSSRKSTDTGQKSNSTGGSLGDGLPDPTSVAVGAADAKHVAAGGKPRHDKTKVPVENAMWSKMRPLMRCLADVSDTFERLGNALSPTPPFPQDVYRLRLAAVVLPVALMSLFVTSHVFVKGVTFGVGFGFFGDPVIKRGLGLLNRRFPRWQKLLELRNTLLKGVPTNAQLTLTLLRIGEANKAPLPPPPRATNAPPDRPAHVTDSEFRATGAEPPLNATEAELDAAMEPDGGTTAYQTSGQDIDAAKPGRHGRKTSKIIGFFRGVTKGGVKTAMGADTVRAKVGSSHARNRLGAAPRPRPTLLSGPVDFRARHNGRKGHVYITSKATVPAVAFSSDVTIETIGSAAREDLHPLWTVPVADIRELKKVGSYGWKYRILVGWSLSRPVADGLEITDRRGVVYKVTAVPLRDELFNRLIAMGGQKWEACSKAWAV